MTEQTAKRKPRYKRVKDAFNIRIQERDAEIVRHVFRHRLLTSEQIAALIGGSRQLILRRLQRLFHAGYLDRPPDQIRPYESGSDPMAYAPANEGARLMTERFGVPASRLNWTTKNRQIKARFLSHTLQVSQFMVTLELAARMNPDTELITPASIYAMMPDEAKKKAKPFIWKVSAKVEENGGKRIYNFGMEPDKVLGLHFPKRPEGRNRTYFFLEADQSSMPLRSGNMYRSSIYKKMVGYFASWEQGLYSRTFPFKNTRVLFVTTSKKRLDNMIELNRTIDPNKAGCRIFLFITEDLLNLQNPFPILDKVWTNGRGEKVSLID